MDVAANIGDLSSWAGGVPIPSPSVKVTDLSPQVDGGARAQGRKGNGRMVPGGSRGVAYDAVLLLLVLALGIAAFHYSVKAHIL